MDLVDLYRMVNWLCVQCKMGRDVRHGHGRCVHSGRSMGEIWGSIYAPRESLHDVEGAWRADD